MRMPGPVTTRNRWHHALQVMRGRDWAAVRGYFPFREALAAEQRMSAGVDRRTFGMCAAMSHCALGPG
ncbi:hypothetical protein XAB3213_1150008 [Xanthomonas citri pv. bilvae]|nr:hypothetical protein XAB3213_1150008 [Xanthomonas citri pv. bilvae]